MPTMPTINFLSPLGHWGHKRRPPGSKRAPASRKASFPRQVAATRRTFHGCGLEPNQTIQRNIRKHINILYIYYITVFKTSHQPALQHLNIVLLGVVTLPVSHLGPRKACKHSHPLAVSPDPENCSSPANFANVS